MAATDKREQSESALFERIGDKVYRVRTRIVVEEVDAKEVEGLDSVREVGPGTFEVGLSQADACSIDKSEQAVLRASWPAMRSALQEHLSAVSKKKPRKR